MIRHSLVRALAALAGAMLVVTVLAPAPAASAQDASATPDNAPTYYVALGDSLSVGFMPGMGDTDQGYADDYYATLKAKHPNLQLIKLGCSGETSKTMLNGGICTYDNAPSQMVAAEQFLQQHRSAVRYITIDIGANDVAKCAKSGIDLNCALTGLSDILVNTVSIMTKLRLAGGLRPTIVGMNLYNPFLAAWLTGPDGQTSARITNALLALLNGLQSVEFTLFGARTADVAAAFNTYDFDHTVEVPSYGAIPVNVATICALTYMCTQHNIHPTAEGYQLIASAFVKVAS